jgi:hypothetical protein
VIRRDKQVGYNESILSLSLSSYHLIKLSAHPHPIKKKKLLPSSSNPNPRKHTQQAVLFIQFQSLFSLLHFSTLSHHMLNQPTGQGARINVPLSSQPHALILMICVISSNVSCSDLIYNAEMQICNHSHLRSIDRSINPTLKSKSNAIIQQGNHNHQEQDK